LIDRAGLGFFLTKFPGPAREHHCLLSIEFHQYVHFRSAELHTWSVTKDWSALEAELGTWNRSSELSAILLAWAVMLKLLDQPDQDTKVQKLGALARKYDTCAWLRNCLQDVTIANNPVRFSPYL
jgi:hypothetical protein